MKKQFVLPLFALFGGVFGFWLRGLELKTSFDAENLPVTTHASVAMLLFSLLILVAAIDLSRRNYQRPTTNMEGFRYAGVKPLYFIELVCAAVIAVTGIMEIAQAPYYELSALEPRPAKVVIPVLLGFFCILAAAAIVTMAARMSTEAGKTKFLGRLLIPGYMCCFWLYYEYQKVAGIPTAQSFMYQLFAIMCLLLAFYYRASFSMEYAKCRRFTVAAMMAIYFSVLSCADRILLSARLRYLALSLLLMVYLYVLYRPKPEPKPIEDTPMEPEEITLNDILNEYREENIDE